MSIETKRKAPWYTHEYLRIALANFAAGKVVVLFDDGTRVQLDACELLSSEKIEPDWEHVTFSAYEIVVPAENGGDAFEIPSSAIRALTDAAFRLHLAAAAAEQERLIGRRLQDLRHQRGLSIPELAARTGVEPQIVELIEQGDHEVDFDILGRMLAALGGKLTDLVAPVAESPREASDGTLNG